MALWLGLELGGTQLVVELVGGVVLGSIGFLVRVLVLSLLVEKPLGGDHRAGAGLLERLIALLQLPISPDLTSVQLMALGLLCARGDLCAVLHALA